MLLRDLSIKHKLTLITMLTSFVALLLACAGFMTYEKVTFRRTLARNYAILADMSDDNVASGLAFNDPQDVEKTIKNLGADAHIIAAVVFDKSGKIYAKYERPDVAGHFTPPVPLPTGSQFGPGRLETFQTITLAGEVIGTICIVADLAEIDVRFQRYFVISAVVLAASALVAFWLSTKLRNIIAEPVSSLAAVVGVVAARKNYSVRAVKQSEDELGSLIDGFNEMLSQIQVRDAELQEGRDKLEQRVRERTAELQAEILERQRAQEVAFQQARLSLLAADVGVALTRQAEPGAMLGECAEAVIRHLDAAAARIWIYHPQDSVLELQVAAGLPLDNPASHNPIPLGSLEVGLIAAEKTPYLTSNAPGDPRLSEQDWIKRHGLTAFAGFPLLVGGEIVGVLVVFSSRPFSDTALQSLASVADGIALGVMRGQVQADLARERDLLSTLLDNSPDHIYFKDRDSRFLRCGKSLYTRFGAANNQEIVGKSDADFFEEKHALALLADEQQIIRTGTPIIGRIEKELWKDGQTTWVLGTKMPFHDASGEIIGTFGISKDITAIKEAEARVESAHQELLHISRLAGMAEVATGVLHNVGNVLNSVNVSATLVSDRVRRSPVANLAKVYELFQEQGGNLPSFLAHDPRGRQIPGYLKTLSDHLAAEQREMLSELESLRKNIEHIKEIVTMQQTYAHVARVQETVALVDLVEHALTMNAGTMARHVVSIVRDYQARPIVTLEKHKVLQILVNLMRNAKYACDESHRVEKIMKVQITATQAEASVSVIDNGIGIPAENLTRIFAHGFTTRKGGHGFGLHSAALAAKELSGSLVASSDGPGTGATFTLTLPIGAAHEQNRS